MSDKTLKTLYDKDFYAWTQETLSQIQKRNVEQIDWEHLAEEVEALGNEQRHAVDSYLFRLLTHLLLLQYWQYYRSYYVGGWRREVNWFRFELEQRLESKSLRQYFATRIDKMYGKARRQAYLKFEEASYDLPDLPEQCPYTIEQILDQDYFAEP